MLIHPGHHLGDSWYYVDGDTVHAYYLVCPDTVERHTAWDIAHATSTNLVDWDLHGIVVERGAAGEWDDQCLATGSVVRRDGRYVMAYTAKWNQPDIATGLAYSDDLFTWTKASDNPNTRPGPPYVVGRPWSDRPHTHWRDPFLVDIDGTLHQLIAAARPDRSEDASGTVGDAVLADDGRWRLVEPLDVAAVSRELECPQIYEIGDRWFLVFSAFEALFSAELQNDPTAELGHGTYAMVSRHPLGPYEFVQRRCILPSGHPDQLYAGQIVVVNDTPHLMGTVWRDDAPDYLNDPIALGVEHDHLVVA